MRKVHMSFAVALALVLPLFASLPVGVGKDEGGEPLVDILDVHSYCYDYQDGILTAEYVDLSSYEGWTLYWTDHTDIKPIYRGNPANSINWMHVGAPNYLQWLMCEVSSLYPDPGGWLNGGPLTIFQENATGYGAFTYAANVDVHPYFMPNVRLQKMPVPTATANGMDIDLTWPEFHQFDELENPLPQIDAQLAGYMVYRSTTNATWNDNPVMGPVSGSPSDWALVGGTAASPIVGTSWTDTGILTGSGNTYFYSIVPVCLGESPSSNVDFKYGGWGSNGIFDPLLLPPPFVYANKSGGNVRLEWSGGSPPFEIYISNNVDGSGFNFAAPDATTSNNWWEHTGVLGDGNSYSYIVREQGSTTNSNIAWKYAYPVQQPLAPNINWVSIPYCYEYSMFGDIGPDVGDAITWEIRCWSAGEQTWKLILYPIMGWIGDMAYPLSPGDAIMIFCSQAPGTWDIVGSHDASIILNIQNPQNPNINWISLPYHHSYDTLGDVAQDIGSDITWEVRAWSISEQKYKSVIYSDLLGFWVGDMTYALEPGDPVLIFCRNAGTWQPLVNEPGA